MTSLEPPDADQLPRPRQRSVAIAIVVGLLLGCAGALVIAQRIPNRAAFDHKLYHLPTIKQFATTWPAIDPWDYLSATTPGYHWLLAGVLRATASELALSWATLTLSAALFGMLAWLVSRGVEARLASAPAGAVGFTTSTVLLCLPLLACNYLFIPALTLVPDNLGWLGVSLMVALALHARRARVLIVGSALALLLIVLSRQIHIWALGLAIIAAWWWPRATKAQHDAPPLRPPAPRVLMFTMLGALPSLLLLALFVRYWGGLVPPRFALQYPPKSLVDIVLSPAPAFVLATTGALGGLLVGFWWTGLRLLWTRHRAWLLATVVLATVIALAPVTTYDFLAGRRTGLWNLAAHAPVVGRTSLLVAGLCVAGAIVLTSFVALLRSQGHVRPALLLVAALAGYALVLCASAEVWQRYVEPLVLIVLLLLSATSGGLYQPSRLARGVALAGVGALTCALLAINLRVMSLGMEALSDPAPPAMTDTHIGPLPPVLREAPPKPLGKRFW